MLHPYNKFITLAEKYDPAYEPPVPINKQLSFSSKAISSILLLAEELTVLIILVSRLLIFILQRLIFFFFFYIKLLQVHSLSIFLILNNVLICPLAPILETTLAVSLFEFSYHFSNIS